MKLTGNWGQRAPTGHLLSSNDKRWDWFTFNQAVGQKGPVGIPQRSQAIAKAIGCFHEQTVKAYY